MARTLLLVAALVAPLALAGCSNSPFNQLPTDTSTPAVESTDTFQDRVTVNGAVSHPFIAQRAGTIQARLVATEPAEATVGLALGTWNTSTNSCQIIIANDAAPTGTVIIGTASVPGNFCARVYDVGRLTGPVDYQLSVTHF